MPPGDGGVAGTPEAVAGTPEAAPGDTIKLIADGAGVPDFTTGGKLLGGDGIATAAEGVTLDLNGHSIVSSSNVAGRRRRPSRPGCRERRDLGRRDEREGDEHGVDRVDDRQLHGERRLRDGRGSSMVGVLVSDPNDATKTVPNIFIGESHGGGGVSVDRSRAITVDTISIVDEQPGEAPTGGDNGTDWKRCTGNGNYPRPATSGRTTPAPRWVGGKGVADGATARVAPSAAPPEAGVRRATRRA